MLYDKIFPFTKEAPWTREHLAPTSQLPRWTGSDSDCWIMDTSPVDEYPSLGGKSNDRFFWLCRIFIIISVSKRYFPKVNVATFICILRLPARHLPCHVYIFSAYCRVSNVTSVLVACSQMSLGFSRHASWWGHPPAPQGLYSRTGPACTLLHLTALTLGAVFTGRNYAGYLEGVRGGLRASKLVWVYNDDQACDLAGFWIWQLQQPC